MTSGLDTGRRAAGRVRARDRQLRRRLAAPVRLPTAADCTRFERESFGALHQMLAGLDDEARAGVWAEIETGLRRFEGPSGFFGACELLVAAGTAWDPRRPLQAAFRRPFRDSGGGVWTKSPEHAPAAEAARAG